MRNEGIGEAGEDPVDHGPEAPDLQERNAVLRRLVWSMALAIPRESLPEDERLQLDHVLTEP